MVALVTADLHLSAKPRDAYRFGAMDTIAELIEKHKVDELIVLGDLTEEKDYHPATLVNALVDVIYSFSQLCEVIILRGNHDYTSIDCPFFQFLRRVEQVRWLNSPKHLDLSIGPCLFLPHTRDFKKDWNCLSWGVNWIFAHNTFEGASSEHGKRLSGIPLDVFEFAPGVPVISGDIHAPQDVGPVTYVGAPYTVDHGDDYDARVFLLRGGAEQSIPILGPQKRLIDITTRDIDVDRIEQTFRQMDLGEGDIVKARVTLRPEEQSNWFEIRDQVKRELIERGFVVNAVLPILPEKSQSVRLKRVQAKSDERVVQDFGKTAKVPEATLKVGLELVREA